MISRERFAQRLLALVESLNERVVTRRGSPLTEAEIGALSLKMEEHMDGLEREWGSRLQAASEAEVPAIIEQWFDAIAKPLERAGLDS